MRPLTLIIVAAFVGCFDQTAHAGGYGRAVRYNSYGYSSNYYQPPTVVYMVGGPIRDAAYVEAIKQQDPIYQLGLKLMQLSPEALQALTQRADAVQHGPQPQQAPQTQLQASCVRCHSGAEPKGGRDFSGYLTADDLKAIKEILPTGAMPPKTAPESKGFSNELAGQVILDAIDQLATDPEEIDPPPLPPPVEDQ